MKRIFIILPLLALLLFTACSPAPSVAGSWQTEVKTLSKPDNESVAAVQSWTFGDKGSGTKTTKLPSGDITLAFTYKIEGDQITLSFADETEPSQTFTLSASGSKLLLTHEAQTITLTKAQ